MTLEPSAIPPERPTEATRHLLQQGKFAIWRSQKRLEESRRCLAQVRARGARPPKQPAMGLYLRCHNCGAIQQHPHIDPGWVWITLDGVRRVWCPRCVRREGPQQCAACGNWRHECYGAQCPYCTNEEEAP